MRGLQVYALSAIAEGGGDAVQGVWESLSVEAR